MHIFTHTLVCTASLGDDGAEDWEELPPVTYPNGTAADVPKFTTDMRYATFVLSVTGLYSKWQQLH